MSNAQPYQWLESLAKPRVRELRDTVRKNGRTSRGRGSVLFVNPDWDHESQRIIMEMLAKAKEDEIQRDTMRPRREQGTEGGPGRVRRMLRKLVGR